MNNVATMIVYRLDPPVPIASFVMTTLVSDTMYTYLLIHVNITINSESVFDGVSSQQEKHMT